MQLESRVNGDVVGLQTHLKCTFSSEGTSASVSDHDEVRDIGCICGVVDSAAIRAVTLKIEFVICE